MAGSIIFPEARICHVSRNSNIRDHAVIYFDSTEMYLDADGLQTKAELIKKMRDVELVDVVDCFPFLDIDDYPVYKDIVNLLLRGSAVMNELKDFKKFDLNQREEIIVNLFLYKKICENELFAVPDGNKFNDWIKMGTDFSMLNVSDAFHGMMRLNPELQREENSMVFHTLQTSMSSIMGENGAMQAKNTARIVWALSKVDTDMPLSDFVDAVKKNKLGLTEKKVMLDNDLSL